MIGGLPDPARIRRTADLISSLPRRLADRARTRVRIRARVEWLTTGAGYRVFVAVHEPDDDTARPAVVLVPGRGGDSVSFTGPLSLLSAREVASRGLRAFVFDPVGRGRSWGHDDFCGSEGQDALRTVLDYVHARRDVIRGRVGVASLGLGLSLAAPVLARDGERLGTRFLLDWEGPGDREAILRTGPLPGAARTSLAQDPEGFWFHREPITWIGRVPCAYHRIQAADDHALGVRGRAVALALVAEADRGAAPSTQLNHNAPDRTWPGGQAEHAAWAPSQAGPLNRLLLRTLCRRLLD